jgi:hypothetical protein
MTVPVITAPVYAMKSVSPKGLTTNRFRRNITPKTINEDFAAATSSTGVRTNLSHIVNFTVRISCVALKPESRNVFIAFALTGP